MKYHLTRWTTNSVTTWRFSTWAWLSAEDTHCLLYKAKRMKAFLVGYNCKKNKAFESQKIPWSNRMWDFFFHLILLTSAVVSGRWLQFIVVVKWSLFFSFFFWFSTMVYPHVLSLNVYALRSVGKFLIVWVKFWIYNFIIL